MKKKLQTLFIFIFMSLAFVIPTPAQAAGICYVNDDAGGSNNGTSWINAYTSLQSAIADSCTEIWVAAGTYKPHASDITVSFALENGTAIYGGFAGTETLLSERDYEVNVTILSGDLSGNDNSNVNRFEPTRVENSYHVVRGASVNNTAILDGLTITGGNAYGSEPNNSGGGIFNYSSDPILHNIILSQNTAQNGGGMFNDNSNPTLTNIIFNNNSADAGSGIYNEFSNPTLTQITFSSNAGYNGGGIYNSNSNPILTNIAFSNNTAVSGTGMFNHLSNPTITHSTFKDNVAAFGGGIYNQHSSPTLTNTTFSTNSAYTAGGAIYSFNSNLNLTNVTVNGNSAGNSGGGIFNSSANLTLKNVIIANNMGGDCIISSSTINASSSNNLIEDSSNACGLTNGLNGNIIGLDPNLGTLTGFPAYFPLNTGSPAINAGTNIGCPADSQNGIPRPQGASCDIGAYEKLESDLVNSILPTSRSVQSGNLATIFHTVINPGSSTVQNVTLSMGNQPPGIFEYQQTNCSNNSIIGPINPTVDIPPGGIVCYVLSFTPSAPFDAISTQIRAETNSVPVTPIYEGVNTWLLRSTFLAGPDIIAQTTTADFHQVACAGTSAFAVALSNVGADAPTGDIIALANTGSTSLPLNITISETDPLTGAVIGDHILNNVMAGDQRTVAVFVTFNGCIPFDPALNRIFIEFRDASNSIVGSTSTAVSTNR